MYRTSSSGLPQHETVLCCCHLERTSACSGRPTKPELAGARTYHLRMTLRDTHDTPDQSQSKDKRAE